MLIKLSHQKYAFSVTLPNFHSYLQTDITALQFHPSSQLLLVGSKDTNLNLFQVNGKDNPHFHTLSFPSFPIYSASFTPNGQSILVSSRKHHFFVHDLFNSTTQPITQWDTVSFMFVIASLPSIFYSSFHPSFFASSSRESDRREVSLEKMVVPRASDYERDPPVSHFYFFVDQLSLSFIHSSFSHLQLYLHLSPLPLSVLLLPRQ